MKTLTLDLTPGCNRLSSAVVRHNHVVTTLTDSPPSALLLRVAAEMGWSCRNITLFNGERVVHRVELCLELTPVYIHADYASTYSPATTDFDSRFTL